MYQLREQERFVPDHGRELQIRQKRRWEHRRQAQEYAHLALEGLVVAFARVGPIFGIRVVDLRAEEAFEVEVHEPC